MRLDLTQVVPAALGIESGDLACDHYQPVQHDRHAACCILALPVVRHPCVLSHHHLSIVPCEVHRANLDSKAPGSNLVTQARIGEGFGENRICRVTVSEILDVRLYEVKDEKVFRECFRDIFQAHYWVYKTTNILHCDISIFNLMVRKGSDGTMIGVLNDWDLAEDQNKASESSESRTGTRTGTRPFMSMELHKKRLPEHKLRFDWESLFYFLIWSTFVIPHDDQQGKAVEEAEARAGNEGWDLENKGAMLRGWWTKNDDTLRAEKAYTLDIWGKTDFLRSPYRFSTTVETWISPIWNLFIVGYSAKKTAELMMEAFDEETLGDHVTFKKIYDILKIMPE